MGKKKYLRKNEFRYYTNPNYKSKNGKPHPAYISARHGRKFKFNVITHTKTFFGKENMDLNKNPNRLSNDKRTSRISVPQWDNDNNFSKTKLSKYEWRFDKSDKIALKKWNKKHK